MRATWTVQAMVNEPVPLLAAFVAHYLNLGADLVTLHLDRPDAAAVQAFGALPKVQLVQCDDAFWAGLSPKGRPPGHPARQIAIIRHVYAQLQHDWLLVCDADELVVPSRKIARLLAEEPERTDYLRIRVAEKVLPPDLTPATVFDGQFRLAPKGAESPAAAIYGPELAVMLERVVSAHDTGKSFVRRGRDMLLGLHRPAAIQDATARRRLEWDWLPDSYLAHFDALTPLHQLTKLLGKHLGNQTILDSGRAPGPRHASRDAQIALAVAACQTPDPAAAMQALHRLTPQSLAALQAHGLLVDLALNPAAVAQQIFPDLDLDFSPQAFDRWLRLKHAPTLAAMGIA
jgi:hypothetical protein